MAIFGGIIELPPQTECRTQLFTGGNEVARTKKRYEGDIQWMQPTDTGVMLFIEVTDEQDQGRAVQVEVPYWRWQRLLDQLGTARERQEATPTRRRRTTRVA